MMSMAKNHIRNKQISKINLHEIAVFSTKL